MNGVDLIRAGIAPTPAASTDLGVGGGPAAPGGAASFAERMKQAFAEAQQLQKDAELQTSELAAGRGSTVETMVALSKADLSLRFVVALRNRAIQAYEELMRMQV